MELHTHWSNKTVLNEIVFDFTFTFYLITEILGLSVNSMVLYYLIR